MPPQQTPIHPDALQAFCAKFGEQALLHIHNTLVIQGQAARIAELEAMLSQLQEQYGPKTGEAATSTKTADPTPLQARQKGAG